MKSLLFIILIFFSKDLSQDADHFAQSIRFGKLNPRFWKRVAMNSLRKQFVPRLSQCSGRVAVLNCDGSHNYFHWVAEVLPRLWTLLQRGEQADWYVADCYSYWQRASLAALGIQLERVIQPHSTRKRIALGLRKLRNKQLENPWKKHDNIPL